VYTGAGVVAAAGVTGAAVVLTDTGVSVVRGVCAAGSMVTAEVAGAVAGCCAGAEQPARTTATSRMQAILMIVHKVRFLVFCIGSILPVPDSWDEL
jgi:hypothetical protein